MKVSLENWQSDFNYENTSLIKNVKIDTDNTNINIYLNPLHNCQIYSIGSFELLLGSEDTLDLNEYDYTIEHTRDIISQIHKITGKTQILIDVYDDHEERVDLIFKDNSDIIFKQPYVNATGSDMIMYLIRPRTL